MSLNRITMTHHFKPPFLFASLAMSAMVFSTQAATASTSEPVNLNFDVSHYQAKTVVVDGQPIKVRAFENIFYVAHPVSTANQVMNIYVPEAYFHGQAIGPFTAETAPIFFPNQIGGYMPGLPGTLEGRAGGPGMAPPGGAAPMGMGRPPADMKGNDQRPPRANTIAVALSKGYVVASPGARGRTTQDASGTFTGKAPAAIVDLKAAVRYLRYNDARMPGTAEKIISNGTSAGGAFSALLGASGNSADYESELKAVGAAPARDDIFAVSAYCPISNLENADSAYEWLFNGVNEYKSFNISMLDFNVQRKEDVGTLTPQQVAVSNALKPLFPAYLNSLGLRGPDGQSLTLDANGNGSFKAYVKSLVIASAQVALDAGKDLSSLDWLTVRNGKATDLDFDRYVRYAGRQKLPPAFDALDLSSGENQLFGTENIDKQHFTAFSQANNTAANASQVDARTVKLMNPLSQIGAPGVKTSAFWRIRHGTKDRDTSLAIPVILAATLQNKGYTVDLALPWDRPHSGDYDLPELFAWMEKITTAAK